MLLMTDNSFLWFIVGVSSTILFILLLKLCKNLFISQKVKEDISEKLNTLDVTSDSDIHASKYIKECKNRLLLQKDVNPDWIEPLKTEIPSLINNIACVYFPAAQNPLLSPDISEFIYAIELITNDITTFLQSKAGRILNVSGNTAHETYKICRNISTNEKIQKLDNWYRKFRPLFQLFYYKSSVMWTFLIGRNIAIRTLQAKVVSIVGTRAIQLYGGKLKKEQAIL